MKIKDNFVLRTVAGQTIVAPTGDAAISFNAMISLNGSGTVLWKALETETTEKQLVEILLEEYEVSREVAEADVSAFVKKMREANLLDD